MIRVAGIQTDIVWEDPTATIASLGGRLAEAAAEADVVVLPEMFSTGFSMAPERVAEMADRGPAASFLRSSAIEHQVWVGGSAATRLGNEPLAVNRFSLYSPDGSPYRYDKIHPFSYAGEDEHYVAGQATLTIDVNGVRVTPLICYDLRFSYLFWDQAEATDCFVVVANWPAARREHWLTLIRARAIENQAYVVAVNRVGSGDGVDYCGDSCVVDPLGEVVAEAGADATTVYADIDPARVAEVRARFPFMNDRLK